MKTVSLDVHAGPSQMVVLSEQRETVLEMNVATERDELRRIVSAVLRPKCVIFEEGPLSGMICDALGDVVRQGMPCFRPR